MQTTKRYTNQTFTKRVDHEAGKHRARRALSEPQVCADCGNVYADRRWSKPDASAPALTAKEEKHPHFRAPKTTICPACKAVRQVTPSGYVHLGGKFIAAHRAEIEQLLINEAERAAADNPLSRIMSWDEQKETELTVTTTTEHLAQRLGHALEKAFSGKARYDFSHENKLAHVWWQRE